MRVLIDFEVKISGCKYLWQFKRNYKPQDIFKINLDFSCVTVSFENRKVLCQNFQIGIEYRVIQQVLFNERVN